MLDSAQLSAFNRHFPNIAADAWLRERITTATAAVELERGCNICYEGDECHHLALVVSGAARVFKLAESGREITLYRVEPGECCILTASCMLSGERFPANATVETELEAVLIPQRQVTAWMGESAVWRQFLWKLLAERLGDVISLVEEVAFRRMDERLGEYLADHAEHHGSVLQATHQKIAADLGTSREVVSRMLKDFEQRGLLQLSRGRIELGDADALHSVSQSM